MASFASLQRALERADVEYAVIGAHAVNAWIEPRFTADFDITVQADAAALQRLTDELAKEGYTATAQGSELPSGPDFVRFSAEDDSISLEVQVAKTEFQRQAIARASKPDELRVATVEDLIVMKLIANRPKDRADLAGLITMPEIDWKYVEHWAGEWDVVDRLRAIRAAG